MGAHGRRAVPWRWEHPRGITVRRTDSSHRANYVLWTHNRSGAPARRALAAHPSPSSIACGPRHAAILGANPEGSERGRCRETSHRERFTARVVGCPLPCTPRRSRPTTRVQVDDIRIPVILGRCSFVEWTPAPCASRSSVTLPRSSRPPSRSQAPSEPCSSCCPSRAPGRAARRS